MPDGEAPDWGVVDWAPRAQAELARLDGQQWAQKKRDTILALVDARLCGHSEETIWDRPDTCSRNTYHTKWKREETFASVLENVTYLATELRGNRAINALQEAVERLALATPKAVKRLIEVMDQVGDLTNARLAATAILDRAGMETAAKSSSETDGSIEVTSDQLARLMRQAHVDATALEDAVLAQGWQPDGDTLSGG